MKFERFKSILLIMLVISSIVLTGNKWFNEELWPGGYDFFSRVKLLFSSDDTDNLISFNPNEKILKPSKIIINSSGNHNLFTKSSDKYQIFYEELVEIMRLGIASDKFETSSIEEWNANLQSKSCYFTYPVAYNSGYFSSQLSTKYSGGFSGFKEFLVLSDLRLPSVVHLYIKDVYSNNVQKSKIPFESNIISSAIENLQSSDGNMTYYSFELNFDSNNDDSVEQAIIIDPDVLISISPKYLPDIKENRLFYNIHENDILYNKILSLFGYNTSNIRKYVESDNSIVFVENYSTLKLHTNDLLDYRSVNSNNGIRLDGASIYDSMNSCITFVNNVMECLNLSDGMYYEISSDIGDVNSKTFTMTFDYYLNDNMIVIPSGNYPISHAVVVEVSNGKITSYQQICKTFYGSGDSILCSSAIEAIDKIPSKTGGGSTISDIFLAYSFDISTYKWNPLWYIEDSNGEFYTIVSGG